jgi:hypothetical protein
MEGKATTRRGAPVTERRRNPIGVRVSDRVRDQLIARAADSGKSITAEVEGLIERALLLEQLIAADLLSPLFDFKAAGERHAEDHDLGEKWTENPEAYRAGAMAAIRRLLEGAPGDWFEERGIWQTCIEQAFTAADGRYGQGLARRRNPK